MKQIIILITTLIFSYTFSYAIEFTDQDIGDRIPIKEPIEGYNSTSGGYLDPFSDDQILFKITSENYLDYETYLTQEQDKMYRYYVST